MPTPPLNSSGKKAEHEDLNFSISVHNKVEFINMEDLKPAELMNIKDVLPIYTQALSTGRINRPIVVDEETNVIIDGYEIYYALHLLSAVKAPAIRVRASDVKLEHSITVKSILEAGLKGPKMPPKSFRLRIKVPEIEVALPELLPQKGREVRDLRVYNSTLELLYKGWPTPLVKLKSFSNDYRSVWAKIEGFNPFSNSVKDRIGWSMIMDALERGALKNLIYEATSTNTGIALTSIANMINIKTKLFIPQTVQKVSDIYLKVLGADVIRLPVGLTVESIGEVDAQAKEDEATHLNQFENDANFRVHLKYTAKEIDEQLESIGLKPTVIIGGLGTSGHMSAISLYFKSKYGDQVRIVGVQPASNEVIPGIRRIETGMKWYHWVKFDEVVDVKQVEAIEAAISIARREGLLIGLSAGAVVHAFTKIAANEGVYVLVFPDAGYKYAEQFEKYFTNIGG